MKHYLQYEIHPEEPVKMGRQGNQTNTESLNYIAGSAIRGAVIGRWMSEKCKAAPDDVLLKKTYFYDAYLKEKDRSMIPMPAVYHADKHAVRHAEKEEEKTGIDSFEVHSCASASEKPEEGEQRVDVGKYCILEKDKVFVKSVRKNANLHIALEREEKESQMFRYEAIDRGQIFAGVICCEDEKVVEELKEILDETVMYLGGSRGSGYGRCIIKNVKNVSWETLRGQYSPEFSGNSGQLTVYALSNLILTDEFGKPTGKIPTKFLEDKLELQSVTLEQAYLSTFRTSGFNHTWRARQIQQSAVSAGSVYIFSYQGKLKPENVKKLEEAGVGMRKQEGFGRILLNPLLSQTIREKMKEDAKEEKLLPLKEESDEKKLLKQLAERIYEKRVFDIIESAAYDTAHRSAEIVKKFSLTQMGRLEILLHDIQQFSHDEAEIRIIQFVEELKSKTKSSYTVACLTLPNGQHRTMDNMLSDLKEKEKTLSEWGVEVEECKKQIFADISVGESDSFKDKCCFLQAVLHNLARMEGGKS